MNNTHVETDGTFSGIVVSSGKENRKYCVRPWTLLTKHVASVNLILNSDGRYSVKVNPKNINRSIQLDSLDELKVEMLVDENVLSPL